jgi:hypothetical protein
VTVTLTDPNGQSYEVREKLRLRVGESWTQTAGHTVEADDPRGEYTLTVSATGKAGTSSATATTEYF